MTLLFKARAIALLLIGLSLSAPSAQAACTLGKLADLPVTMVGLRPVVAAKLNGLDAQFVADSGAFYSMISHASAVRYGLRMRPAPFGFFVNGATGAADVEIGVAKNFEFAGITVHDIEFLVGGSEVGAETAGLIGQNVFHIGDVEYDLADGAIRIFRPHGCGNALLAYWLKPDQAYSSIAINSTTQSTPHTMGLVSINGVELRAMFDTGADTSVLALDAAARLGIKPTSPGVVAAGRSGGIGRRMTAEWIVPVASFKIGDEEIKNTRLRMAALEVEDVDMLVGADFFLAHRVYVATSQRRMFFSYNGGPVFNLETTRQAPVPPPTATASAGSQPTATSAPASSGPPDDVPSDAAGYSRRGAAYAARHDYDKAIVDLTKAIELAPANPDYVLQRAQARLANNQPQLAMADLDQTLKLKPDDLLALLLRAELNLHEGKKLIAIADLDAADRTAAKQDNARFSMAQAYGAAGAWSAAIAQYDLWIAVHDDDAGLPQALNGRCWARALLGQDLDKALHDCNAALRLAPKAASFFDSRGLVYLRRGELDKAVSDYNAALALNPHIGWSLYGRGLAELRQGLATPGAADIAAATAINPKLPDEAKAYGLAPVTTGGGSSAQSPPAPAGGQTR